MTSEVAPRVCIAVDAKGYQLHKTPHRISNPVSVILTSPMISTDVNLVGSSANIKLISLYWCEWCGVVWGREI